MLCHKTNLNKFLRVCLNWKRFRVIFSSCIVMKLKISSRGKAGKKIHKYVTIKQYTFKQPKGQKRNHKEIGKDLEINETTNKQKKADENLWYRVKAVLRGKFMAVNSYIKKERSYSNNLTLHLKELEKPKARKRNI